MKSLVIKSGTTLLLFVATIFLSGCDLFDKVDDVSFTSDLEGSIVVTEAAPGTDVEYVKELSVDATSDAEINKYKNKIKDFKVNSVKVVISDYSGSQNISTSAGVSYAPASGGTAKTVSTINITNVQSAANTGDLITVPVEDADLKAIAALLKADKAVKFKLDGTLSETPVSFKVKFVIDAKITAEAL